MTEKPAAIQGPVARRSNKLTLPSARRMKSTIVQSPIRSPRSIPSAARV